MALFTVAVSRFVAHTVGDRAHPSRARLLVPRSNRNEKDAVAGLRLRYLARYYLDRGPASSSLLVIDTSVTVGFGSQLYFAMSYHVHEFVMGWPQDGS
jgi:hypothetical protein